MRLLLALAFAVAGGRGLTGGQTYSLKDKTSSFVLLESGYPQSDFDLELIVNCSATGRVLDTAGIDAAPSGSWSLQILPDRHVAFYVFDGTTWHVLVSKSAIPLQKDIKIHLVRVQGGITLSMDGQFEGRASLNTALSVRKVFVGDYKGDERFGNKYDIYQSMTGNVRVTYFGAPRGDNPVASGNLFRSGRTMIFLQPEAKLYMTADFDSGKVNVKCATAQGVAPRTFAATLNPGTAQDDRPWGTSAFEGGGGGDVYFQFDTAGRYVTTYWQPSQGPAKWMIWARVAKVGDSRRATPEEIESLNGGER